MDFYWLGSNEVELLVEKSAVRMAIEAHSIRQSTALPLNWSTTFPAIPWHPNSGRTEPHNVWRFLRMVSSIDRPVSFVFVVFPIVTKALANPT